MQTKKILSDALSRNRTHILYKKAIPEGERVAWPVLLAFAARDGANFVSFYEDGVYIGFCFFYVYGDLAFILYLAVEPAYRSKGLGSAMLEHVFRLTQKRTVVLNIESVNEKYPDNGLRRKRRHFYFKNGFHDSYLKLYDKSGCYDVLYRGNGFSKAAYRNLLENFTFGFGTPELR